MKLLALFICSLTMTLCSHAQQTLQIALDTSSIIYPDNARIFLSKVQIDGKTKFVFDRKQFKGMVSITNYLLKRLDVSLKSNKKHQGNEVLYDSSASIFEKQLAVENERANNYKESYLQMKKVSDEYHQQLLKCADDLNKLSKEKSRAKKMSFVKGALLGLAIGAAGGAIAVGL